MTNCPSKLKPDIDLDLVGDLIIAIDRHFRCCETFFDILDSYSENKKSRAAVWPFQILLLVLSPVSARFAYQSVDAFVSNETVFCCRKCWRK